MTYLKRARYFQCPFPISKHYSILFAILLWICKTDFHAGTIIIKNDVPCFTVSMSLHKLKIKSIRTQKRVPSSISNLRNKVFDSSNEDIKGDPSALIHSWIARNRYESSHDREIFAFLDGRDRWIFRIFPLRGGGRRKVYTLRRFVWPNFPRHRYSVAVNAAGLLRFLTTAFASIDIYDCGNSKMYLYRKHDG